MDFWLGFAVCYLLGAGFEARALSAFQRQRAPELRPSACIVAIIALAWPINHWQMGSRP